MDTWTFCETLGPVEGNKLMRAHWDSWVNETLIADLAATGVELLRLPVGDWTLDPYGPYVGCMDGAAEKIDWLYDVCAKYNISVLMSLHAVKDSQNGDASSGRTSDIVWTTLNNFTHEGAARWFGDWNSVNLRYEHINFASINWALMVIEHLLQRYGAHSAFYAFSPLNEPQTFPLFDVLKEYYQRSRKLVQKYTAGAKFVMSNSGQYDPKILNSFFRSNDMANVIVDFHFYMAWSTITTVQEACDYTESTLLQFTQGL